MRSLHAPFLAPLAFVLVASVLASCGGGGESSTPLPPPRTAPDNLFVNPVGGLDNNDGILQPVKTITQALALAIAGDNIFVLASTYDAASGEIFPLIVPARVSLIGSPSDNGLTTIISGGGYAFVDDGRTYTTALALAGGSTVAGFTVTNGGDNSSRRIGVLTNASDVTIRNCRIVNNGYAGIDVYGGTGQWILGNRVDNNYVGIGFVSGAGAEVRIDNNTITNNHFGVEFDAPGTYGDLGGGTAGSTGGNVLSGNTEADLYTDMAHPATLSAKDNFWDHLPTDPLFQGASKGLGFDIVNINGIPIDTTGAQVYVP